MSEEVKKQEEKKEIKQTAAEMELELKKLEVEAKKLELLEREANLQDVRERLAERELKRDTKRMTSYTNGATLKQLAANDKAAQTRCNHRKGGNGADGIISGQGDDSQFAVLKHQFANGDTWVRCLRCGKTWKPPLQAEYTKQEEYIAAVADYQAAVKFQTRNITSGAIMFKFSDGGQMYREKMINTNLR